MLGPPTQTQRYEYYRTPCLQVLASEKSVEKLQKDVDYANSLISKAQKKAQKED